MTLTEQEKRLTPRQRRIAARVATGMTDKQIGADLNLTEQAVQRLILRIAGRWQLERSRNLRVQITRIVLRSSPM